MNAIFEGLLWSGSILLLIGATLEYRKHLFRILGFSIVGLFWLTEVTSFIEIGDYFNASLVVVGSLLFVYLGYHEYLSKKWNEDPRVMEFLAGTVSMAMIIYFLVQRIPLFSGALIDITARHSTWIVNRLGHSFTSGAIDYGGTSLFYRTAESSIRVPIEGSGINIILACTGLQVMAAGAALIWQTAADLKPKLKSILLVVGVVYVANLLRNVMIIHLTVEDIVSFEMAHNQIAKILSMIVLIVLLLVVFEIIPELFERIMDIVELPKREPIEEEGE